MRRFCSMNIRYHARISFCGSMRQPASRQVSSRSKREKLQAAYNYLMSKEADSSYRDLVKKHNKFLRQHPDPSDSDRRLPLQFIETPGPVFFWDIFFYFWKSI